MKKVIFALLALMALAGVASCNDYETYAEQKEKENNAISKFVRDSNITVISEATFRDQGYTTDVAKNEYVLFGSTGVYMQIVRKGTGSIIADGETCTVLCRFWETNLLTDSITLTNEVMTYSAIVDKMSVTRTSDSFIASFDTSSSVMYQAYQSTTVPAGWLVPLLYINVGRNSSRDEDIAYVKLIVPHSQGHQYASSGVYPCYYEIKYEKGR